MLNPFPVHLRCGFFGGGGVSSDQSPQYAEQVSRGPSPRRNLRNMLGKREVSFDWHLNFPKARHCTTRIEYGVTRFSRTQPRINMR
jgi:hypothetical protein